MANLDTIKASNPKDRVGIGKVPQSVVPSGPLMEMGLGMMEGALKYGAHNYRVIGVRASVYYDAAERHLKAFWEGEDIDPDSGLPHIVKAMCCLAVLRDAQILHNWVDDRPPSYPEGWQKELNLKSQELLQKYPDPKKPYLRAKQQEPYGRQLYDAVAALGPSDHHQMGVIYESSN